MLFLINRELTLKQKHIVDGSVIICFVYCFAFFLLFSLNEHKYDLCNSKGMSLARVTMKNEA